MKIETILTPAELPALHHGEDQFLGMCG